MQESRSTDSYRCGLSETHDERLLLATRSKADCPIIGAPIGTTSRAQTISRLRATRVRLDAMGNSHTHVIAFSANWTISFVK